jgi:prolyl oligopeptidase
MIRPITRILLTLLGGATAARLQAQQLVYPPTERRDVSDNYAGHTVVDPYRWLENLDSSATKQWVEAENAVTFAYLAKLPQR